MSKGVPLNAEQRQWVRNAMENGQGLFEISKSANVSRVIDYLLEDKLLLENYLTAMAESITRQRKQISCRIMILSIFPYERSSLKLYDEEFVAILTAVVEKERKEQRRTFASDNHLQINIHSDLWKIYVSKEIDSKENRYILFGGRILNMEEHLEKRLLKNIRAHRVRGGICSDITGCKSDIWNCLECKCFVPDAEQLDYYLEQIALWKEKSKRFADFPVIRENSERNAELFEHVAKKLKGMENQDERITKEPAG